MKILNDCLIEKCLGCRNTDYGVIRTNGTIGCIRYINGHRIISEVVADTIDKDCPLQDICLIPSDEMSKGLAREIFLDTGIKDIDKVIVVYKREEK